MIDSVVAIHRPTASCLEIHDSATSSDIYCMMNNMLYIFPCSGPPSKPTTPVINATTIQTLTFSFSVDSGSSPIRYFLLNITEYPSGSPNTFNISVDDNSGIIQSLTMFERRQTILAYYVEMRVSSQLNNQADYVFAVAAENNISIGEFSNASIPARLGEHMCGL